MNPAPKGPFFRALRQTLPHRVLAGVLPLVRVAFLVPQSMMKTAGWKRSQGHSFLGELILPKTDPAFDGKFQIFRCAEQVQMAGHQDVVADQPSGRAIFPYLMQRLVDLGLSKPRRPLFGADCQEDPIWPAKHDVPTFCGYASSGLLGGEVWHGQVL